MKRILKNICLIALCFTIVAVAAVGVGKLGDLYKTSGGVSTTKVNVPTDDSVSESDTEPVSEPEPGPAELGINSFVSVYFPKAYIDSTVAADPNSGYYSDIGFIEEYPLSNAIDGDITTYAASQFLATEDDSSYLYYPSIYVDSAGLLQSDMIQVDENTVGDISSSNGVYIGFFKLSVAKAESLGSVVLWGDTSLKSDTLSNNTFDVYISEDGIHWELLVTYTDLCGFGSDIGTSSDCFDSDSFDGSDYFNIVISMENATVVPNYIGFAVVEGANFEPSFVIFREITLVEYVESEENGK